MNQADREANVKDASDMQTGRQIATAKGDGEAMIMRRFTRSEHDRGDTVGWRLDVGWFRRASGLEWAWFRKDDDSTQE